MSHEPFDTPAAQARRGCYQVNPGQGFRERSRSVTRKSEVTPMRLGGFRRVFPTAGGGLASQHPGLVPGAGGLGLVAFCALLLLRLLREVPALVYSQRDPGADAVAYQAGRLFHVGGIARSVILDLEPEKFVDRLQGVGIVRGNPHLCAAVGGTERVSDRVMLLFHHGHAGRHGVMDEHRHIEVVGAEHGGDVREVHSNLVAGRIVVFGFRIDFNDSAIGEKCEVVGCGFVGKAHGMIATHVDASRVIRRGLGLIGRWTARRALCECRDTET